MYNSMKENLIPCTQAMLLEPALAFENIITASGDRKLTWKNTDDAEKFIRKLRMAPQALTDANRRLHKLHREIESIVIEHFSIDLLRMRERWTTKGARYQGEDRDIRLQQYGVVEGILDMQIYKALEHQYQLGLERLHEVVAEIKVDITCDSDTGLAALRLVSTSYVDSTTSESRIPSHSPLDSVGVVTMISSVKMPGNNERGVFTVMKHAAQVFKMAQQELKRFHPLLVVGWCGKEGNHSLEDIVSNTLKEVQHCEQSISLLKQKGKEVNADELIIKCGCITIRTAYVKGTVEDHLYKLSQVLHVTLHASAQNNLSWIKEYLTEVSATLGAKLTRLDAICAADLQHAQLMERRPTVEVEFHHLHNKNVLLLSMANKSDINFRGVKQRWDEVTHSLDAFEREMEEQIDSLKMSVDDIVSAWMKSLERFSNQWHEVKPKTVDTFNTVKIVMERREQFKALKAEGEEYVCRDTVVYRHIATGDLLSEEEYYKRSAEVMRKCSDNKPKPVCDDERENAPVMRSESKPHPKVMVERRGTAKAEQKGSGTQRNIMSFFGAAALGQHSNTNH